LENGKGFIKDMPSEGNLKIILWNINGIRALKDKGSLDLLIKNGNNLKRIEYKIFN